MFAQSKRTKKIERKKPKSTNRGPTTNTNSSKSRKNAEFEITKYIFFRLRTLTTRFFLYLSVFVFFEALIFFLYLHTEKKTQISFCISRTFSEFTEFSIFCTTQIDQKSVSVDHRPEQETQHNRVEDHERTNSYEPFSAKTLSKLLLGTLW